VGLARQLEAVEQRLEEAEARSAEDHHFAADMHAWNLQLLAQQKADQQRIRELEEICKVRVRCAVVCAMVCVRCAAGRRGPRLTGCGQALMEEKEERGGNGDDSGDNYLPRQEELQTMTRDQLNEVERRQEEYLLTIRKIKVHLFPHTRATMKLAILSDTSSLISALICLFVCYLLFVISHRSASFGELGGSLHMTDSV
jgi:hypothetical protein